MTFGIEERDRESPVLAAVGRLDGAGARALEARVAAMTARGDTRVDLDCSRMTYVNSAGVRALLICARSCRRAGGRFTVFALQGGCRTVLEVSGLMPFLEHQATDAAALDAPHGAAGRGHGPDPGGRSAMTIEGRRDGAAVLLSPAGHFDAANAPALEARIRALVAGGNSRVVLECSAMTYIGSTGLRSVLVGAKACGAGGGKLVVAALQPACRMVFEMSGFLSVIEYHETSEAAVAAVMD